MVDYLIQTCRMDSSLKQTEQNSMARYTKKSLLERANIAEQEGDKFAKNSSYESHAATIRSYTEANNLRIWSEHGFLPGRPDDLWTP